MSLENRPLIATFNGWRYRNMRPDALSPAEIEAALATLPGWRFDQTTCSLIQDLKLRNFSEAFALMTRIAMLAEQGDHHPDWSNSYNRVTIRLTTHDAGGVTEKDFALARQITLLLLA